MLVPTTLAVLGTLSSCPQVMMMQCWKSPIPPPIFNLCLWWIWGVPEASKIQYEKFGGRGVGGSGGGWFGKGKTGLGSRTTPRIMSSLRRRMRWGVQLKFQDPKDGSWGVCRLSVTCFRPGLLICKSAQKRPTGALISGSRPFVGEGDEWALVRESCRGKGREDECSFL